MAKNDNLTDFLTDVADAIRAKKGTTDKINPQDFASEIASIETSQEVVEAPFNDVNFRDYDGTILYSYSKDEFLALTELPPLPTQKGLICQEWNWTYDEAMAYVGEYGILEVGATYITDDGATRLYMQIINRERLTIPIYFQQTNSEGIAFDWGDGSEVIRYEGTGKLIAEHTYASAGEYIISIKCDSGTMQFGHKDSLCNLFGPHTTNIVYAAMLRKIESGENLVKYESWDLSSLPALQSITLPNIVVNFGGCVLYNSYTVGHITLPRSVRSLGGQVFLGSRLRSISFSGNPIIRFANYALSGSYALQSIVVPKSEVLDSCCFQGCKSLGKLVIPKSVTTINNQSFNDCPKIKYYDFTHHESIPTLTNINAFNGIPTDCEIRVPKALEEEWKQATNWCDLADKIVGYD